MRVAQCVLLVFLLAVVVDSFAQHNQVCFTVDDLPVQDYGNKDPFYAWDVTLNLISKFDRYQVPAIGFVNERKLYSEGRVDSSSLDVYKLWFQNGYEIGNHTFSHKSYHRLSYEEFTNDVMKGEEISRHLELEYNKELVYFRHPYLHIGNTKERYDSLNVFLKEKGYTVAPVTINANDWAYAGAYAKAEKSKDMPLMDSIAKAYITATKQAIEYAQVQSKTLFNRNIKHVLLIHANKLNADYMEDLVQLFIDADYKFIPLNRALEDEAYETEITEFRDFGHTWPHLWGLSQHQPESFFSGAPQIPDWVNKIK